MSETLSNPWNFACSLEEVSVSELFCNGSPVSEFSFYAVVWIASAGKPALLSCLDNGVARWQSAGVLLTKKLEELRDRLRACESCLVAYSGGVDSVFLAHVARDVLGERALAVIADSPSLPRRELAEALELGERFGFPVRVVRTREFQNADYLSNPANRCYFCKHELFTELVPIARSEGFKAIVYGENASDVGDIRPGAKAAEEFEVRAPLKEAGLTKEEIRALSGEMGLPTADKPQMACLSSRVPHGEAVTPEKLRMIEEAEYVLRDLGFYDVRVRHHELKCEIRNPKSDSTGAVPVGNVTHLARIEVGPKEMRRFLEDGLCARVGEALRGIGYGHVTLDLQGYRRPGVVSGAVAVVALTDSRAGGSG